MVARFDELAPFTLIIRFRIVVTGVTVLLPMVLKWQVLDTIGLLATAANTFDEADDMEELFKGCICSGCSRPRHMSNNETIIAAVVDVGVVI